MRMFTAITVLGCAAAVAGCATITKGTDDLVTIDTDPGGAQCFLFTENKQIAVINPTPGSIKVPKSKKDLSVRCEKDGYFPTEGVIASSFQAMTIGNVLFGGIIGVAIDAGSGAMHKYEEGVSITLIPESFTSEEERDDFFDTLREDFIVEYYAAVVEINNKCAEPGTCKSKLKKTKENHDARLAEIEAKRAEAKIVHLIPESFSSAEERDGFFDMLRADYLAGYDASVVKIKDTCAAAGTCESQLKDAEENRDKKLAEFEAKRAEAKIL